MQCPKCSYIDTRVLDTRDTDDNRAIRRRRQCLQCSHRFTTLECLARAELSVIKRDGRKEDFSPEKIIRGIQRTTQKLPIDQASIDQLVNRLINHFEEHYDAEIPTSDIGQYVMNALKELDPVAYIRFASVCKEFRNIQEFTEVLST